MMFEQRSLNVSLMLHLGILLVAAFGLPALLPDKTDPEPMVMTVELLPISAMTNVKPSDKPLQKAQNAAKQIKTQEPPKPQAKPEPRSKPEPKPEPKPDTKPEPMEKAFDPNEEPEEKEPKKEEKKEEDFEKLLNDLKKESEQTKTPAKDQVTKEENKTMSKAPYDDSLPLSISEKDAIRSQFIPCWSPPMGAKDTNGLIVRIQAQYKPDGTLIDAKIASDQMGRYGGDTFFRAAADAAMRAVRNPQCNPLKNLDASKYGSWRDMEITFDPAQYY